MFYRQVKTSYLAVPCNKDGLVSFEITCDLVSEFSYCCDLHNTQLLSYLLKQTDRVCRNALAPAYKAHALVGLGLDVDISGGDAGL